MQLTPAFGFDQAAAIVPYLARLGISHLYCSPYLQAAHGSTHGYDVVDHYRVNEELGGEEGRARLIAALKEHGLGHVIDVVPNHMAIGGGLNRWWWDVLKYGRESRYASYFDVDWDPPEEKLRDRVLMAILGDHYGRVLEAGELKAGREGEEAVLRYHEHLLPLNPDSVASIDDFDALNADWEALDALLEAQHYRLAYWRTAMRELDYRRFFDVDTLIGLRAESEEVFEQTHVRVLEWVKDGSVDGLRIDHPDGLRDPEGYLTRLRERSGAGWVVVEKILEPGESLPDSWPVEGTTGYDFLNELTGLFVDPAGEEPLTELYRELTGEQGAWEEVALTRKHQVMDDVLAADLSRLAGIFVQVCERNRRYRDYTRFELRAALQETLASFPVYRTYLYPGRPLRPEDTRYVEQAVSAARERRPDVDGDLFEYLAALLLREDVEEGSPEAALALRFQQLSGPVMAKGVEDTAFYNFNRFVALNEVGGDPGRFGVGVEEFHAANSVANRRLPHRMLASSTHDTKRSEDVRARLAVLSEMPAAWGRTAGRWMWRSDTLRGEAEGIDRNFEYLLYQVIAGAWPLSRERLQAFATKASREAKAHTTWLQPNEVYDAALAQFVDRIFDDEEFLQDIEQFVGSLVAPGRTVSLAQLLLKLTSPGIPDVYQGTELWDLSLVDPDNRRPVDYGMRTKLLEELEELSIDEVLERSDEGFPKLLVMQRTLALRAGRQGAFDGAYDSIAFSGSKAEHVMGFVRGGQVVAMVPRLVLGIEEGWAETMAHLPNGTWRDVFTGEEVGGGVVPVAQLMGRFPVALLELM